jgi:hypothetical protein
MSAVVGVLVGVLGAALLFALAGWLSRRGLGPRGAGCVCAVKAGCDRCETNIRLVERDHADE